MRNVTCPQCGNRTSLRPDDTVENHDVSSTSSEVCPMSGNAYAGAGSVPDLQEDSYGFEHRHGFDR